MGSEESTLKFAKAQGLIRGSFKGIECPMAVTGADPDHLLANLDTLLSAFRNEVGY